MTIEDVNREIRVRLSELIEKFILEWTINRVPDSTPTLFRFNYVFWGEVPGTSVRYWRGRESFPFW